MKTYKSQTKWGKVYRQVRYSPAWFITFAVLTLGWLLNGCPLYHSPVYKAKDRWDTPRQLWRWSRLMAALDMQDEVAIREFTDQARPLVGL